MAHSTKSTGSRIWASRPFQSLRLWWNLLISIAVICCQARAIPLTVDEPVRPASVAEKIWHSQWLVGSEKCYTLLYCNTRYYLAVKPDHFIDHLQKRRKNRVKLAEWLLKWTNLQVLSPKLETLSLRSEGKLSMDPESDTVSEMDRGLSSAPSLLSCVSWRNTYTEYKCLFIIEPGSIIGLLANMPTCKKKWWACLKFAFL